MIHSENKQGFTLVEVLLSIMIIGIVITALMSTQSNMLFYIETLSNQFSRLVLAKNLLYQTRLNGKSSAQAKTKEPETTFKYSQKKATGNIGKQFKGLYLEQVEYEWTNENKKQSDKIVSFIFKPEKKEEAA